MSKLHQNDSKFWIHQFPFYRMKLFQPNWAIVIIVMKLRASGYKRLLKPQATKCNSSISNNGLVWLGVAYFKYWQDFFYSKKLAQTHNDIDKRDNKILRLCVLCVWAVHTSYPWITIFLYLLITTLPLLLFLGFLQNRIRVAKYKKKNLTFLNAICFFAALKPG